MRCHHALDRASLLSRSASREVRILNVDEAVRELRFRTAHANDSEFVCSVKSGVGMTAINENYTIGVRFTRCSRYPLP